MLAIQGVIKLRRADSEACSLLSSSLEQSSTETLTDVGTLREKLSDRTSDDPKAHTQVAVFERGRKLKRKVPVPQQKGCEEKDTSVLRPPARKSSLTTDHKPKPDSVPSVFVKSERKDVAGETVVPQPNHSSSSSTRDSCCPLEGVHAPQPQKVERVQIATNVVPPPRVKRRDGSLPPETAQKTTPSKILRGKETCSPSTAHQKESQTPEPCETVSHLLNIAQHEEKVYVCGSSAPESELNIWDDQEPLSCSIIKKIGLHKRDTRLPLSTHGKNVEEKCKEEKVQTDNTQGGVSSSHETEDKERRLVLLIPRPRVRKRLSGSITDDPTSVDGSSQPSFRRDVQDGADAEPSREDQSKCLTPSPLSDKAPTLTTELTTVRLRRNGRPTGGGVDLEDSSGTQGPSKPPVPKPRVKKRLSGSFPDNVNVTVSSSSHPETSDHDSFPPNQQSSKNLLRAVEPEEEESTSNNLFPQKTESPKRTPEGSTASSHETKDRLLCSSVSKGDLVSAVDEGAEYEERQEVPTASVVEGSPEKSDAEKILDEIGDWTFPENPVVTGESEKASEETCEMTDTERVLTAEVDRPFISSAASAHDDWLHVEVEKTSRKDMRDEEVDFGFVSVDVAAGCLQEDR